MGNEVQVFLQPGQVFASAAPVSVVTIVGSCVAVCLFDPVAKVGGMNHFLLPLATEHERSPRFGPHAVAQLIEEVLVRGARGPSLRAKVFGGACVMDAFRGSNLGEENVQVALTSLDAAGIPVVGRDVGGRSGRKLVFHTAAGSAWVRRLSG